MSSGSTIANIKPTDLRGILKYVPRFQGQIFVIALDGAIVADDNFGNLLIDIAVLRSLGIKMVLVHGIGRQIEELSTARNIPISDVHGTGVTDAATLDLAIRASARVSQLILEGLTQNGLKCAITNSVRAIPVGIIKGVEQQFTGKVDRIDKEFIVHLISADIVPIVSPIGFAPDGHSLRINSDLLAAEFAEVLQASKIIYLAPLTGLYLGGELRREVSVESLRETLKERPETIAEEGRSKAAHAIKAIETGTTRVHLLDGRVFDGLLNEIFSNEGVGTLIYGNDYQQIRKATRRDVRLIYNLTRHAVKREETRLPHPAGHRKEHRSVFRLRDRREPDCVRVPDLVPRQAANGRGRLALRAALLSEPGHRPENGQLRLPGRQGARRPTVLALSTQSYSFFISSCGFAEADKSVLPESRLKGYEENGRNSKILVKPLV